MFLFPYYGNIINILLNYITVYTALCLKIHICFLQMCDTCGCSQPFLFNEQKECLSLQL
jgi:hypothetical protein